MVCTTSWLHSSGLVPLLGLQPTPSFKKLSQDSTSKTSTHHGPHVTGFNSRLIRHVLTATTQCLHRLPVLCGMGASEAYALLAAVLQCIACVCTWLLPQCLMWYCPPGPSHAIFAVLWSFLGHALMYAHTSHCSPALLIQTPVVAVALVRDMLLGAISVPGCFSAAGSAAASV